MNNEIINNEGYYLLQISYEVKDLNKKEVTND